MRGGMQMDAHQVFSFAVDTNTQKLVAVRQQGRSIEVNVRLAADVVLDNTTTEIRNAIDPHLRTDEHGLIIEWKQPMIPGWDWLTYSRKRRF